MSYSASAQEVAIRDSCYSVLSHFEVMHSLYKFNHSCLEILTYQMMEIQGETESERLKPPTEQCFYLFERHRQAQETNVVKPRNSSQADPKLFIENNHLYDISLGDSP
jgi:hypothetical protein